MAAILKPAIDKVKTRLEILSEVKIEWEAPIIISNEELNKLEKGDFQHLWESLVKFRKEPAVYLFNLSSSERNSLILNEIQKSKKESGRNLSHIDSQRSLATDTLYVGSVKSNLHGRLVQHLGLSNHQTGALQLIHWAKNVPGLQLEFHYAILDVKCKDITEWIEYSVAEEKKPLIGKKHKI